MAKIAHQAQKAKMANLTSMLSSRRLPPPWDPLQARAAVLLSPLQARAAILLPLQARAAVLLRPLRARVPLQWPWIR